jgi:hypothetical protein
VLSSLKNSGPPVFLVQPQSQTVTEGRSVTFQVEPDGTPPYGYQWFRDGVELVGNTGPTYSIVAVDSGLNGARFSCRLSGAEGSLLSVEAVLTVEVDTAGPRLLRAQGSEDYEHVTLTFDEPVGVGGAQAAADYSIPGLVVVAAQLLSNGVTVVLTTSPQVPDNYYLVTVQNVKDLSPQQNATSAPYNAASFGSFTYLGGFARVEIWASSAESVGQNG